MAWENIEFVTACLFVKENRAAARMLKISPNTLKLSGDQIEKMGEKAKAAIAPELQKLAIFADRIKEFGVSKFIELSDSEKLDIVRCSVNQEKYTTPPTSSTLRSHLGGDRFATPSSMAL